MLSQLYIKLMLPMIIIGAFFMFLIFLMSAQSSTALLLTLFVLMLGAQAGAFFYFYEKLVGSRLNKLQNYIDVVVSLDKAPQNQLTDLAEDDFAQLTNKLGVFIEALSSILDELRMSSNSLKSGSALLSTEMGKSVLSVDDSASQIQQMAHSIEQVATTSQVLSDSALQVSETTGQVLSILSQGTSSSRISQQSIESFANEVNELANDLALLKEESSSIGSVLDVIRGIADQTNLLALNAAIEAARAGEQGRGFAVVADEVRALAHRTQESTVEIQSMVEGLQEKSINAVNAITRGKDLTQESLTHSEQVVDALQQIGEVFSEVDNLSAQIASGTEEQQRTTESMNDNMSAVVNLSKEINYGLTEMNQQAKSQHEAATRVENSLRKICV